VTFLTLARSTMEFYIKSFSFNNVVLNCQIENEYYGINIPLVLVDIEHSMKNKAPSSLDNPVPECLVYTVNGNLVGNKFNGSLHGGTHSEMRSITIDVDRNFLNSVITSLSVGGIKAFEITLPDSAFESKEIVGNYSGGPRRRLVYLGENNSWEKIDGFLFVGPKETDDIVSKIPQSLETTQVKKIDELSMMFGNDHKLICYLLFAILLIQISIYFK
jgi:hypothetical protein